MSSLPFQPVPNTASLVAQYSAPNGDLAENVFHVLGVAPWDSGGLTSLCNAFVAWFSAIAGGLKPSDRVCQDYALVGVTATGLDTDHDPVVSVLPTGGAAVGTGGVGHLNAGLTLRVKFLTGLRGRSFRGGFYFVGLDPGGQATDKQSVLPLYAGSIVANYAALKTAIHAASANWQLCIVSRFAKSARTVDNPLGRRASGLPTPVTGVAVSDFVIDFQRRRATAHSRHG